jgi:hypothetical protein
MFWVRSELRMLVPIVSKRGIPEAVVSIVPVSTRTNFRPSNREAFPTPHRKKEEGTSNTSLWLCPTTSIVKLQKV